MRYSVVFICLMLSCGWLSANPIIMVEHGQSYAFNRDVDYLLDYGQALSLAEVQARSDWQGIERSTINFGFINAALWLRFDLQVNKSSDYRLHIPYPLIDHLDHYSFIDGVAQPAILTGDAVDFYTRPIDHNTFVFPYYLERGQRLTVYLRVASKGSKDVPLRFSSLDVFTDLNDTHNFFRGFVSGILWLMLFYNLFIYFAIRDRLYLLYVLHIFACLITSNSYDGTSFRYIWPSIPILNDYVFAVFNGLIQVTSILFLMELLQVHSLNNWFKPYFKNLLYVVSTFPVLGLILPYGVIVPIEVVFSIVVNSSALILGMYLSLKGNRTAQYFTVAISLFMIGLMSSNLKGMGLLPTNVFTQYAYQFGFFIEMVVLSLALTQKIDASRKDKLFAQKENIKNLKRYEELYNESLSANFKVALDGTILSVNPAFCQILGYKNIEELFEVNGGTHVSCIAVDKNIGKTFNLIFKNNEKLVDYEGQAWTKTKDKVWISLNMRITRDEEQDFFEGSFIDVTQRKENQNLREESLKTQMSMMEHLVVGISHEINTPLGVSITSISHLKMLIQELDKAFVSGQLTKDGFKEILEQEHAAIALSEQNLFLVNSLIKRFKQISTNQLGYVATEFSLRNTLTTILNDTNEKLLANGIEVDLDAPPGNLIYQYEKAIMDVIHELLDNSIEHGFTGNHNRKICIRMRQNDQLTEIRYQDNGCGLTEEGKGALFNPFYTTQRGIKGKIGLGMYLVFNLATQLLNGTIKIQDSNAGLCIELSFSNVSEN